MKWKEINDYEGYYKISNTGVVKSMKRNISTKNGTRTIQSKMLVPRLNNCGYLEVRLSRNGITSTKFVHVLLAKAFLMNTDNKPEVNHINGIKADNRLTNLEWVTHSENMLHAYKYGLCKVENKQTPVIDICTGKIFPSIMKASEYYSLKYTTCKGYLNGNRKNPTCLRYMTEIAIAA